jgi:acetyl esterase/lipase
MRYIETIFDAVQVERDLIYGRSVDETGNLIPLTLDLYQPQGDPSQRRPVIVWAHGGGFETGDKGDPLDAAVANTFARYGWVVASVNYRLRASVNTPDQFSAVRDAQHDIQASVRWLKKHSSRFLIDADAIVVAGSSSGAEAALHVAYKPEDAGDSGTPEYPSDVAAGIAVSGTIVNPAIVAPGEPPVVLFHAVDDTRVPFALGAGTCALARATSNTCILFAYPHGGHPPDFLEANRAEIVSRASAFACREIGYCAARANIATR